MSPWCQVLEAKPAPHGRVQLRLACGHTTLLDPVAPLSTIARALQVAWCNQGAVFGPLRAAR